MHSRSRLGLIKRFAVSMGAPKGRPLFISELNDYL
jgi:hypothetical protein